MNKDILLVIAIFGIILIINLMRDKWDEHKEKKSRTKPSRSTVQIRSQELDYGKLLCRLSDLMVDSLHQHIEDSMGKVRMSRKEATVISLEHTYNDYMNRIKELSYKSGFPEDSIRSAIDEVHSKIRRIYIEN